jgi:hypothetical protein
MGSFGGNCGRIYFDDFWVASDYLGDIRVDLLIPTAEGNTTQMTPLSGTDNALMADETPPDDDTTYNSSATAGDKDTYVTSNVSSAGTIHGLRLRARARKTDAGARSIATVIRSGGTDYDGTTTGLGTAYLYYSTDYYTNPNTAAAWTSTEVNAIEIGAKVAA